MGNTKKQIVSKRKRKEFLKEKVRLMAEANKKRRNNLLQNQTSPEKIIQDLDVNSEPGRKEQIFRTRKTPKNKSIKYKKIKITDSSSLNHPDLHILGQITAALDLPSLSEHTYGVCQNEICQAWETTTWDVMKKSGDRERETAIKEGRVNKDGIALIDVIADGCWSKRSCKTNCSALSGAAAILGRRFGQVLFMSVKNKYCCICARSEKQNMTPKEHECFKNYSGASTAMESVILAEGFKQSIEMHQVIYARLIVDGNSSTYSKILESRPYSDTTVEKINCRNHIKNRHKI